MKLKTVIISSVLACILSGPALASPEQEAFIEDMFATFNAHDVDGLKEFYAVDAVVYAPESCEPTVGRDAIGASYAAMFDQIPDLHDELEVVITEGNKAAVMFTASSKMPGADFELPIAAFLTIENGLVVEDRVFFDSDMSIDCTGS